MVFCADLSLLSVAGAGAVTVTTGPIDGLFAPSCFWAIAPLATKVAMRGARPNRVMFFINVSSGRWDVSSRSLHARSSDTNSSILTRSYRSQTPATVRKPPQDRAEMLVFLWGKPGQQNGPRGSRGPPRALRADRADRHEPRARLVLRTALSLGEGQQCLTRAVRNPQCNVLPALVRQRVDLVDVSDATREMPSDVA